MNNIATFEQAERRAYKDGYTQAVTDLKAENEKLKIALKESIALICSGTEYEVEIERYREFVDKAKQLII